MVQVSTKAEYDAAVAAEETVIEVIADIDVDALPTHPCEVVVMAGACIMLNGECWTRCDVGTSSALLNGWTPPEGQM